MNIISLSHITKNHRVLMDTSEDKTIYAEIGKRKLLGFIASQVLGLTRT